MTREEKLKILIDSGEYDFLKNIPENELWKVFFMATFVGADTHAVSVGHGEWIDNTCCSECGWINEVEPGFIRDAKSFHFCPNCGKKMDGGAHG